MSKIIRRAFLGSGAFLFAACGYTPIQYAPYPSSLGGYSEIQVSPEIYRVRVDLGFFNHPSTPTLDGTIPLGSVEHDLALLRSAELTLEKGSRYFVIDGGECRDPHLQGHSVVCKIKIFSERPAITDPSVLVYRAVEVQREIRSRLEPRSGRDRPRGL